MPDGCIRPHPGVGVGFFQLTLVVPVLASRLHEVDDCRHRALTALSPYSRGFADLDGASAREELPRPACLPVGDDVAALVAGSFNSLDGRVKLAVSPDLEVLWSSRWAGMTLRAPSPLVIERGRLAFPGTRRAEEASRFLVNVGNQLQHHIVRADRKHEWVVLRACRLPLRRHMIAVICAFSTPCRGVEDSGLAKLLGLTPAETSVLELVARLYKTKQIAENLRISVETVRSHLKQIYVKAEVDSAAQLHRLIGGFCAY